MGSVEVVRRVTRSRRGAAEQGGRGRGAAAIGVTGFVRVAFLGGLGPLLVACAPTMVTVNYSIARPKQTVSLPGTVEIRRLVDRRKRQANQIGVTSNMSGDTPCFVADLPGLLTGAFAKGIRAMGLRTTTSRGRARFYLEGEILEYHVVWRHGLVGMGYQSLISRSRWSGRPLRVRLRLVDRHRKQVVWAGEALGRIYGIDMQHAGQWTATSFMETMARISIERVVKNLVTNRDLVAELRALGGKR